MPAVSPGSTSTQTGALPAGVIRRTVLVADRGSRPLLRGWSHAVMAVLSLISSTVLVTYAWLSIPWWQALGVTIYGLGFISLFVVSGLYHRWPFRSAAEVQWWRRADHSVIAVFIASTYTPLSLIALDTGTSWWMLLSVWIGATLGVILNMVWINHPRWLDVVVYLTLGWLVVPLMPALWDSVGPTVVGLLFTGGVTYSLGALVYGFKWPGRSARIYGYHEHFHSAVILAAVVHLVAVWLVVVAAAVG